MSAKSEYEAAYYSLLRAREEAESLHAWQRMLEEEQTRLTTFITQTVDHPTKTLPFKLSKRLDATSKPVVDAIKGRLNMVQSELRKLPDTISAQEQFVVESEEELAVLKSKL